MSGSLEKTYLARYENVLKPIAELLKTVIESYMFSPRLMRIDRIVVRAKDPDSFLKKAAKKDEDAGVNRYSDPLTQIQDQIGARIIMFYLSDVDAACARVMKYLTVAEQLIKEPESEWEFGYFGRHFILSLPRDAVPPAIELNATPLHFELQIRTLFQHAWSEADHDIVYKAPKELSALQKRQCAFAAAQSWGADQVFQGLFNETGGKS
jgi:putative GTP pyrophosphokinase